MSADEAESIDFGNEALGLLLNKNGKVTPYGVVYDNRMVLERIYDGWHFPAYDWRVDTLLRAEAASRTQPAREAPNIEHYFEQKGVRFIAVGENIDTLNGTDNLVFPFTNVVNSFYARQASTKTKAAHRASKILLLRIMLLRVLILAIT